MWILFVLLAVYKLDYFYNIVINAMISLLGRRVKGIPNIWRGVFFIGFYRITLCDTNYSNSIINEIINLYTSDSLYCLHGMRRGYNYII